MRINERDNQNESRTTKEIDRARRKNRCWKFRLDLQFEEVLSTGSQSLEETAGIDAGGAQSPPAQGTRVDRGPLGCDRTQACLLIRRLTERPSVTPRGP